MADLTIEEEIRARSGDDLNGGTAEPLIWISRMFVEKEIEIPA